MTPEEIQALVTQQLEGFRSEIKQEIITANQGLAANLTREFKKLAQPAQPEKTEETEKESLTLKSLKQQISELQASLEAKDKQAFEALKRSGLAEAINQVKALSPGLLQKVFMTDYGQYLKQEDGTWYVESPQVGIKPLATALQDFLKSEDGKLFVPASGVNGSGATETKTQDTTPNKDKTAEDILFEHFG
ncbi:hypothetical protein CLI64_11090 [Nostoc sp. CENA543]|uniref:hypothetical protein n=1 Tax=Nostoc sp. CENA543 TaxID=1869241 RepID=UPI000CA1BC4E|nr:hypothetical protein [Nostoc sp. CENA543]AUT00899.1 hypothetical protein CLI64_11090 [Nostoc sp. CENA543]